MALSLLHCCRCVLALLLVLLSCACTERPSVGHAPRSPRQAPTPTTPAVPAPPLADEERDPVLFEAWRRKHAPEVGAFEAYLVRAQVAQVVPTYQLLRSASMWKECHADPFELPPPEDWDRVRELLVLLQELKNEGVLPQFEVVSAYRDPRLNRCAGGAPSSAHQRFAVDLAPLPRDEGESLCRFWHAQGPRWNMGVSRYPTGRIHIDRDGWRTWGATHHRASSFCLG
jgi:hypothetical protein